MSLTSQLIDFIIKHWLLVISASVVGLLLMWDIIRTSLLKKYTLSPQEVAIAMSKKQNIYDIRPKAQYTQSHISQAKWVKLEKLKESPEKILTPGQPIILYCDDGTISKEIASFLRIKHGFKTNSLEGGLALWQEEGFSVDS